jgi:hypothetical protein
MLWVDHDIPSQLLVTRFLYVILMNLLGEQIKFTKEGRFMFLSANWVIPTPWEKYLNFSQTG